VFYEDQVTDNVRGHWWSPLWRLPVYVAILAVNYLPWSLPALEAWGRGKWKPSPSGMNSRAQNFLLAWCLTLVAVFALGENISVRYLLPAAPMGAILLAEILTDAGAQTIFFSTRRILIFILGLDLLVCAAALAINAQWDTSASVFLAANLFAVVVLFLGLGALSRNWLSPAEGLGLAIILIFPLLFLALNRVLLPDPCEQMAMNVKHAGPPGTSVLFVGRPAMASGVRLFLENKCTVTRVDDLAHMTNHLADYAMVLAPEKDVADLERLNYQLHGVAVIPGAPPLRDWWSIIKARQLPDALEHFGRKYFLMMPAH
jgi:hypothetical protein